MHEYRYTRTIFTVAMVTIKSHVTQNVGRMLLKTVDQMPIFEEVNYNKLQYNDVTATVVTIVEPSDVMVNS